MADRILAARSIHKGWLDVSMLTLEIAGETVEREVVEHPSGAAVLAYDPDRRVALLVSESRPPVLMAGEPPLLEAIAGALDGDAPVDCARREAREEGGVALGEIEAVGRIWATPATSTERVSLFLAAYRESDRVGAGGRLDEEQEHLRVHEMPLAELWTLAERQTLEDAKTLLLLQALRIRRPELFL